MHMGFHTSKPSGFSPVAATGNDDWEEFGTEFKRRVVLLNIYGDTGTGRTHLALTAPGPIAIFYCSEKVPGLAEKVRKATGKRIRGHNFDVPQPYVVGRDDRNKEMAAQAWAKMKAKWTESFTWARTIILDTHTDAWELLRVARFGDIKPGGGRVDTNYGPVNAEFKSLFSPIRRQEETNIIIIGKTGDEYKDTSGIGQKTGKTIPRGMKEVPFMSEVIVRTHHKPGENFRAVIEKGWFNAESETTEFEDDEITFGDIMSLVTGTKAKEWERERVG